MAFVRRSPRAHASSASAAAFASWNQSNFTAKEIAEIKAQGHFDPFICCIPRPDIKELTLIAHESLLTRVFEELSSEEQKKTYKQGEHLVCLMELKPRLKEICTRIKLKSTGLG